MRTRFLSLLGFAAVLLSTPAKAAPPSPRDSLLVSAAWLSEHLKDPNLVLLHVGDKAEYDTAHIPGARYVSLQDISVSDRTEKGLTLEMPATEALHDGLAALGISDNSRVIVYFGKDWVSPSTRVMFTLDYAGLGERSSLLDGGQPAWVRAGQPVTGAVPDAKSGTLAPLKIHPTVVTGDFVRQHLNTPGQTIVDARDSVFYDGTQAGGRRSAPKAGHIAGAVSIPFSQTTDDHLMLKSAADLESLFTKAGVKPGDTVIGYCHIGQQATATLFTARTLGYKVMLYDGSFEDWSSHPDYPVTNPNAAAPTASPREK